MTSNFLASPRATWVSFAAAAAVAGCGGGGGTDGTPTQGAGGTPTVATASAGSATYGKTLVLTLTGTNLDQGISVSATGCDGVTIDTSSSGSTAAQYECTVSAMGPGQFVVTRTLGGATLGTASFTVPAPQVTMNFSNGAGVSGSFVLTLAPDKTPITVNNFLSYVNAGFYAGTVFHRVSPGFVVQGGGYTAPLDASNQNLKPTNPPIALEVGKGLSNTQWTIAMARNSDTASATSQFFINLVDNSGALDPGLSAGYAVFGMVTSGTADRTSLAGAPCVAIPQFLPAGDCTPTPNMEITSAMQTR